jgi:death on curing protein
LTPEFLDVDDVLEIHAIQIIEHGGSEGLRDPGLLRSAVAQPMAQFAGAFLNEDLFEMAAALLTSLVKNHPFVDGNKRTALNAALAFLDLNGYQLEPATQALVDITRGVAAGEAGKSQVAAALRSLAGA